MRAPDIKRKKKRVTLILCRRDLDPSRAIFLNQSVLQKYSGGIVPYKDTVTQFRFFFLYSLQYFFEGLRNLSPQVGPFWLHKILTPVIVD